MLHLQFSPATILCRDSVIWYITGTSLYYQPGVLHGGEIEHECSLQRGIGYYLEMLICLAPFCKKSILATLKGITSEANDPSVRTQHFII